MKESSVLAPFSAKVAPSPVRGEDEADLTDDLGAFGWLRGVRERSIMLSFHQKNGNIVALPYAWLDRAEFNPSVGITLNFGKQIVNIVGRNLNAEVRPLVRLFDGLARHRIPWVREADRVAALAASERSTIIEQIEFVEPAPQGSASRC